MTTPFYERVKNVLITCANDYNDNLVEKEYLLYSSGYTQNAFYILKGRKTNYLHLTGVHTSLSPMMFFDKCINGTLCVADIDTPRIGTPHSAYKGNIRKKIQVLPSAVMGINGRYSSQENFNKNRVSCTVASSEGSLTLGYVYTPTGEVPNTLLKGDLLDTTVSVSLDIILVKGKNSSRFTRVIHGDDVDVRRFVRNVVPEALISNRLRSKIKIKSKKSINKSRINRLRKKKLIRKKYGSIARKRGK